MEVLGKVTLSVRYGDHKRMLYVSIGGGRNKAKLDGEGLVDIHNAELEEFV